METIFFLTLLSLGAQIRGAQTWYTIVSSSPYQPLSSYTDCRRKLFLLKLSLANTNRLFTNSFHCSYILSQKKIVVELLNNSEPGICEC